MIRNQAGFSTTAQEERRPINATVVRSWFEDPVAVAHYARAADALGLWRSESIVFKAVFSPGQHLLDVGCGAGRIALGLWRMGFPRVTGCDYCAPMIAEAQRLAERMGSAAKFILGDAREIPLPDRACDGAVFGFNGLMQIPGREHRRRALAELNRVVIPEGNLVFTTHDRDRLSEQVAWRLEAERWKSGSQDPALAEFGDRILHDPEGRVFMHVPDRGEVLDDLAATGWSHVEDHWRSDIANESQSVREFSDECRFWIARRERELHPQECSRRA